MKWFTSDWHLGEDRIGINGKPNLFYRPFESIEQQNATMLRNFINSGFKDGDELWHLGDVVYKDWDEEFPFEYPSAKYCLQILRKKFSNSKFHLIIGNYDEDKLDYLQNYFDDIQHAYQVFINDANYFMNHYPINCKNILAEDSTLQVPRYDFAITGHIHGLWKVQKGMVNVGVDAWHFKH